MDKKIARLILLILVLFLIITTLFLLPDTARGVPSCPPGTRTAPECVGGKCWFCAGGLEAMLTVGCDCTHTPTAPWLGVHFSSTYIGH